VSENHPIQVSEELIQQWWKSSEKDCAFDDRIAFTLAAQWGADQELEACRLWLNSGSKIDYDTAALLCAARRPKPPSLKEQAFDAWDRLRNEAWCEKVDGDLDFICRALEALPND